VLLWSPGAGSITELRSVVDAARCVIEMQTGMIERRRPPERRTEFHLGDVVEESDRDLMGDDVKIAARLDGVFEPGGVCVSAAIGAAVRALASPIASAMTTSC
jgi:adenylate cyclase